MKNSKEYSEKFNQYLSVVKKTPVAAKRPQFADPLEALIFGLIGEFTTEANAQRIYKRICSHFVDFNDLRVSRPEEILDVMDDSSPAAQQAAVRMTRVLHQVYDRYDRMSLSTLKEGGKRQGRKELEELDGISRFAVDYCFLTAFDGHAIPLKEPMRRRLIEMQLLHPESTDDEIHGFLERQINAADGWTFYAVLCGQCEGALDPARGEPKARGARKSAAAPKTTTKRAGKK